MLAETNCAKIWWPFDSALSLGWASWWRWSGFKLLMCEALPPTCWALKCPTGSTAEGSADLCF